MNRKSIPAKAAAGLILAAAHCGAYAVDSASAEFAAGNQTHIALVGAQWNWKKRWPAPGSARIGGYWDLTLAWWHSTHFHDGPGATQNIADIGITPVFRLLGSGMRGLYAEAGVGIHSLSGLYDNNNRKLSTRFQFGDRLGFGYVFRNGLDIGLLARHFSNAGIKEPNDGVNFAAIRIGYTFK